jgi:hypothetical protein
MDKRLFTYRIPLILTGILIWEFIFWISFFGFLLMMGYFSHSNIGPQMGFKNEDALPFLYLILPLNLVFLWFICAKYHWKPLCKNNLRKVFLDFNIAFCYSDLESVEC